jgi:hypothetical protein
LKRFSLLHGDHVTEFFSRLERVAVLSPDPPVVLALPRDPKDEPYLNLAIALDAPYSIWLHVTTTCSTSCG